MNYASISELTCGNHCLNRVRGNQHQTVCVNLPVVLGLE